MPNQEIHIHANTGANGIVHLDIPVGMANQDVDITVLVSDSSTDFETKNADHLIGSFNSADGMHETNTETTVFENAVIDKLSKQGVELP